MADKPDEKSMLTAGKIAKELNVSAGAVKNVIKSLNIDPDLVKGGCAYYSAETLKKIKESL
jgi:hypothetical protein